jgi:hypothetical protein
MGGDIKAHEVTVRREPGRTYVTDPATLTTLGRYNLGVETTAAGTARLSDHHPTIVFRCRPGPGGAGDHPRSGQPEAGPGPGR